MVCDVTRVDIERAKGYHGGVFLLSPTLMARRTNDAYYTPAGSLSAALELAGFPNADEVEGVLEPSAGSGVLVSELRGMFYTVWSNELYPPKDSPLHNTYLDLCHEASVWSWLRTRSDTDVVIGNPPYKFAPEFVRFALLGGYQHVFYLLRLSWLERCRNREDVLDSGKLRGVVVTPRLSFTGDGRKDMSTTAWFWYDSGFRGDPWVRWLK